MSLYDKLTKRHLFEVKRPAHAAKPPSSSHLHFLFSVRETQRRAPPRVVGGAGGAISEELTTVLSQSVTEFQEPALSVRVEEGVRQVVPVVLRDFERLVANALVQFLRRHEVREEEVERGSRRQEIKRQHVQTMLASNV